MSNQFIERKTSELLRRHFLSYPPVSVPVPVERIAETTCDLLISWEPLAAAPGGVVLGELRAKARKLVLNDKAQGHFREFPGSDNFTLAHEVGHWVLHVRDEPAARELFADLGDAAPVAVCTSSAEKPLRERQADRFASYLLMPADLTKEEALRFAPHDWPTLYRLRDRLGVSISALCYRLEELRILDVQDGEIRYLL